MIRDQAGKNKILFFGIDGASWNILQPLIEHGDLPNFNRMIEQGFSARMHSIEPILSSVLWTTISTGKLPDKHGVKDFYATSKTLRCKRSYDILQDYGYKVGNLGDLITWPPKPVNGFNIPDLLARDTSTYPAEYSFFSELIRGEKTLAKRGSGYFLKTLKKLGYNGLSLRSLFFALDYLFSGRVRRRDSGLIYFKSRVLKLMMQADLFSHIIKKLEVDYAFFHIHIIDTTCHTFWQYYDPQHYPEVDKIDIEKYKGMIPMAYRHVDRVIGKVSERIDPAIIIVASDHGMKATLDSEKERFIVIRADNLLDFIGLRDQVRYSAILLGLMLRASKDDPEVEQIMVNRILKIGKVGSGEKIFQIKSVGHNNFMLQANYSIDCFEGFKVELNGKIARIEDLLLPTGPILTGTHDPENAVLIMKGGPFRKAHSGSIYPISDIFPTLLHALTLPVGRDMDGKVIDEAFTESFMAKNPIAYIDSHDGDKYNESEDGEVTEEIKAQLKDLGYL